MSALCWEGVWGYLWFYILADVCISLSQSHQVTRGNVTSEFEDLNLKVVIYLLGHWLLYNRLVGQSPQLNEGIQTYFTDTWRFNNPEDWKQWELNLPYKVLPLLKEEKGWEEQTQGHHWCTVFPSSIL